MLIARNKGYTLLEMLLVISIIAVLSSLAFITFRNHQQRSYIEKAALEIQNALSAAISFYEDTGSWPFEHGDIGNCDSNEPSNADGFVNNYLPNQTAKTLFGNYYCWAKFNEPSRLFWFAVKIPHANTQLAKRIAALLPNAIVTTNPAVPIKEEASCTKSQDCYVRIELTSPGQSKQGGTYVAGVGNCVPNKETNGSAEAMQCIYNGRVGKEPKPIQYTIRFHCPTGMQGSLIASANFLDVGKAKGVPYALRELSLPAPQCRQLDEYANQICKLTIYAARANRQSVATGAGGHIGASYTAYCQMANHKASAHFAY